MSDLISREKLKKELTEKIFHDLTDEFYGTMQVIDELPSAQEWIPVSERLPEKGGWYLVTWEDQFKTVRRVAISEFIEPKGLTDIWHFEGFALCEIIAWMPLPEPYRPEEVTE